MPGPMNFGLGETARSARTKPPKIMCGFVAFATEVTRPTLYDYSQFTTMCTSGTVKNDIRIGTVRSIQMADEDKITDAGKVELAEDDLDTVTGGKTLSVKFEKAEATESRLGGYLKIPDIDGESQRIKIK